jgi:predicted  nucleic acid-binding Zn-ribbon protein
MPTDPASSLTDRLRKLYLVDRQIQAIRGKVDANQRYLDAQTRKLEQLQRQTDELQQQVKEGKSHAHTTETEANVLEERITKLRDQMNTVTNNKEYSALLVEVNTLKIDKSKLEDQALEHLSTVEQQQSDLDTLTEQGGAQQKVVDAGATELKESQDAIAERLAELNTQREEALLEMPDDVLARYQKLLVDHDGEALAPIEEQDRKRMEYTCGECYMTLPVQVVNSTLSDANQPTTCTNCGRILYAEDELKEVYAEKS